MPEPGVAVKVTPAPEQMLVCGVEILTVVGTDEFTVIVIWDEVAEDAEAQAVDVFITTSNLSLFEMAVVL